MTCSSNVRKSPTAMTTSNGLQRILPLWGCPRLSLVRRQVMAEDR
jgi:hypothetical protein